MKKMNLIVATLCLPLFANAAETRIVTETEIAQSTAIAGTVGNCSGNFTDILLTGDPRGMNTIRADFNYAACEKVVTFKVQVEGKVWNAKRTRIAGSDVVSYRLTTKQDGESQTLFGSEQSPLDALTIASVGASVGNSCRAKKQLQQQTARLVTQTGCQGQ